MPHEEVPPTRWEKIRDNATSAIALGMLFGLYQMHTDFVEFKAETLSRLDGINYRVGRLEDRLDRVIENGSIVDER